MITKERIEQLRELAQNQKVHSNLVQEWELVAIYDLALAQLSAICAWIQISERTPELNEVVVARKHRTAYPEIITYMAGARWGAELTEWVPLPRNAPADGTAKVP